MLGTSMLIGAKDEGVELKKNFFAFIWSTYKEQFKDNLKRVATHGKEAVEDLLHYATQACMKTYFSSWKKCDMVDNDVSETFNSWIKDARDKYIITMIELVRIQVMNRMCLIPEVHKNGLMSSIAKE